MNTKNYNDMIEYYKYYYSNLENYCQQTAQFFKRKLNVVEIDKILKLNDLPFIIDISKNNNPLLVFLSDKNKIFYNRKLLNLRKT